MSSVAIRSLRSTVTGTRSATSCAATESSTTRRRLRELRSAFVRGAEDTPKSEAGESTIALGPKLAEELWQHRRRAAFSRDGERVFCHPTKGSPLDHKRYAKTLAVSDGQGGSGEDHAAFRRRPAHVDHELRRGRSLTRCAHGSSGTLRLQDDPGIHRPGRRDIPRRGRCSSSSDSSARIFWRLNG